MRGFRFLFFGVWVLATAALFLPGCTSSGDDDNPGGPGGGDTLTTAQVLQEIDEVAGSFETVYVGCDAAALLPSMITDENVVKNSAELTVLVGAILHATENAGDLSPFYGTWVDTTPVRPEGAVRVSDEPEDGVRIRVVGADAEGQPDSGSVTLYDFLAGEGIDSVRLEVSVTADGSAESLWVRVAGEMDPEGGSGDLEAWAHACGANLYVHANVEGEGEGAGATISGWYEYAGSPRLNFEVTGFVDTAFADSLAEGGAEGTLHAWTTADPEFDLVLHVVTDPDTCMTGEITIDDRKEADIYMVGCGDTATVALLIVIDGETFDGEELLGEMYEALVTLDLDQLADLLELVPEKGIVPPILWPMSKSHAEALERFGQ
jgi:hypothetical protein